MKKISILTLLTFAAVLLISCGTTAEVAKAAPAPAKAEEQAPEEDEEIADGVLFSGEVEKDTFVVENNHQYGINYQSQNGNGMVLPKTYTAQKGDQIILHIEGTWSKDIVVGTGDYGEPMALGVWIVDQCAQASYWTPLTNSWVTEEAVIAGEPFVLDFIYEVNTDAKAIAGARGADITFYTSSAQEEESVLTTTVFTYEIIRE